MNVSCNFIKTDLKCSKPILYLQIQVLLYKNRLSQIVLAVLFKLISNVEKPVLNLQNRFVFTFKQFLKTCLNIQYLQLNLN